MCGKPQAQQPQVTQIQRSEIDPALQRLLYGGTLANPRGGFADSGGGSSGGSSGGGQSRGFDSSFGGGNPGQVSFSGPRTSAQQAQATSNLRNVRGALGMARSNSPMEVGGLYAMGGMVAPQEGIASLNQGQMPLMNGQMPNLSDPMTAATLAMALRSPEMQYGSIAQSPMMQTNFNVGGYVEGPGTGTSDSIDSVIMQNGQPVQQAKLSDGEFVMTERAVTGAGNGDREAGAARMYELMRQFERGGRV